MDEPYDSEAEHPEEHPGADRSRRRLPHEPRAALRVDPERREKRDLREDPVDVEEALVAPRPLDEVSPEHLVDVERAEGKIVGDGGRVEEEGAEREERDAEYGDRRFQKASPTAGAGSAAISSGSGSASRRTGAAYGYRSVTSSA